MANKVNSQFWPCFEYYEYVFVFHLKWSDTKTRFWVDCDFKNLDLEILPNGKTNEKKNNNNNNPDLKSQTSFWLKKIAEPNGH